ncbi:MAG TPA: hypothetical protein VJ046_00120 [Candidatus Paceibacterota bacterium]|nr:hypothetical protein [Candidatus Paceibacterota bacterium]
MEKLRKIVAVAIALVMLLIVAGCADSRTINGKTYEPYGLLNQDNLKEPCIRYEPVWGNILWGAVLFETVIAPIYFFGFSILEPVGEKQGCSPSQ